MRKILLIAVAVLITLPLLGEQKNVKELTGLSDFQLVRAMQEMADGLGVGCAFCHVEKDKELDFAADGKEEKQRAREMIALTKATNTSTFKGRSTVSCYTCHRGKNHPSGLVPLPVAPPPNAEEHEERPKDLPSAADLVKKYADAIGNVSRWASVRAKGVRESQDGKQSTPFELEVSNGRYHVVSETPRGKMEQAVGATAGWVKAPEAREMNARELELSRDQAAAYTPTDPKDIGTDPKASRVVGKEKIGDHETYILFTGGGPTARQRLYFDATSGLLIRRVVLTDSPVGTIPSQSDFEEWKDVGGTKFPFVVKWSSVDWRSSGTRKYSDVTLAAKIEDRVFEK